jgi:hypothetical protein
MAEFSLDYSQKLSLEKYGEDFKKWIKISDGMKNIQEHRRHESYFKRKLSPERLDKLSEQEFKEIYTNLWASNVWENKEWYVRNRLIDKNGLEKIRVEFKN